MAIKSNVPVPVIEVADVDTVLLRPLSPITRAAVQTFVLHNPSGANVTITIFESPDETTASGTQVAEYILGPDETADVFEVVGQSYASALPQNLIAIADVVGANARLTITQYDGSS